MARSKLTEQGQLKLQMRKMLGEAYAFVRGREYTKSIANITIEELMEEAIDRIKGTSGRTGLRETLLERIKRIQSEVATAVTTVKKKPASDWSISDADFSKDDLANTPEKTVA